MYSVHAERVFDDGEMTIDSPGIYILCGIKPYKNYGLSAYHIVEI